MYSRASFPRKQRKMKPCKIKLAFVYTICICNGTLYNCSRKRRIRERGCLDPFVYTALYRIKPPGPKTVFRYEDPWIMALRVAGAESDENISAILQVDGSLRPFIDLMRTFTYACN